MIQSDKSLYKNSDLYIAKYHSFEDDTYVVADLKTGKEYVLNRGNIMFYVRGGKGVRGVANNVISIYQPENTITTLQVKTATLLGLDIKVYKSEIVEIKFKYYPKRVSRIRLSDFGVAVDKDALANLTISESVHAVLILDDKLRFKPSTFCHGEYLTIRDIGIMLDITELSDKTAKSLYRSMIANFCSDIVLRDNIIDREERIAFYSAKAQEG